MNTDRRATRSPHSGKLEQNGITTLFEKFFNEHPKSNVVFKRTLADGDLVALHLHSRIDDKDLGRAIVDIFRFENGKIVEHWDVVQAVPEKTANGNTMFEGTKAN